MLAGIRRAYQSRDFEGHQLREHRPAYNQSLHQTCREALMFTNALRLMVVLAGICAMALTSSAGLLAQSAGDVGGINGLVLDHVGRAITGAAVQLKCSSCAPTRPPAVIPAETGGINSGLASRDQEKATPAQEAYNRGMALAQSGKHDEALKAFYEVTRRLEGDAINAYAWFQIGKSYLAKGNGRMARQAFRFSMHDGKLRPDTLEAAQRLLKTAEDLESGQKSDSGANSGGSPTAGGTTPLVGGGAADLPTVGANPLAGGSPSSAGNALFSYGKCDLTPNYVRDKVNLVRWAGNPNGTRIQISVSVSIDRRLPGLSAKAAERYRSGARLGAGIWGSALATLLGGNAFLDLEVKEDDPSAQIKIILRDSVSPIDEMAEGEVNHTYGTVNGHHVITGAEIVLHRAGRNTLKVTEGFLERGTWSEWQFESKIGEIVAHEMGHALGINGHSSNPADLMASSLGEPQLDFKTWISQADANTLLHAYCGQRLSQAPPPTPTAATSPTPLAPFVGRWDCRTDEGGFDGFVLRRNGTIDYGEDEPARVSVSGSGIRFEEPAVNHTFFDRRIFEFTLTGGQLRGTRTETGSSGSRVDRYTCTRVND